MAKPKVTKTDTGFNVDYGDLVVGVHEDQAKTKDAAIKVAQPQYEQFKKDTKDQE